MLLGLGGLIVGVATDLQVVSIIVGVIGFLVMLGGVILAVTPTRGTAPATPEARRSPHRSAPTRLSWIA